VAGFAAITSAFVPRLAGESLLAAATVSAALTALARPIPKFLVVALTLVTGLALALDSPPHVTSAQEASAILVGTFCGAVILLLVVVEGTIMLWREWQRLGVRIVGSWIAASAIMVLALGLAR
jgi:urease accessory protein